MSKAMKLRIKRELRTIIDQAAVLTGKTASDFIVDAVRRAAQEAILDNTVFAVTPKTYAEFLAKLDAPPCPNARLRRCLRTLPPWKDKL